MSAVTMRLSRRATTLLWHLMDEGTATVEELVMLTGWTFKEARSAIGQCFSKALVRRADEPRTNPAIYGLTPIGKEQAANITDRSMVDFACAAVAVTADEKAAVIAQPEHPAYLSSDNLVLAQTPSTAGAAPPDRLLVADDDFVCLIDTRGVIVVNLTETDSVMFPARAALKLQRILGDIKFLERLEAEGSL